VDYPACGGVVAPTDGEVEGEGVFGACGDGWADMCPSYKASTHVAAEAAVDLGGGGECAGEAATPVGSGEVEKEFGEFGAAFTCDLRCLAGGGRVVAVVVATVIRRFT